MVSEELKIKDKGQRTCGNAFHPDWWKRVSKSVAPGSEDDFFQYSDDHVSSADGDNSDNESNGE
jgi:hypothetical protein